MYFSIIITTIMIITITIIELLSFFYRFQIHIRYPKEIEPAPPHSSTPWGRKKHRRATDTYAHTPCLPGVSKEGVGGGVLK